MNSYWAQFSSYELEEMQGVVRDQEDFDYETEDQAEPDYDCDYCRDRGCRHCLL